MAATAFYKIGNLTFGLHGSASLQMLLDYEGLHPFALETIAEPALSIELDVQLPRFDDGSLLSQTVFKETESLCLFSVKGDTYQFEMWNSDKSRRLVTLHYQRGGQKAYLSSCNDFSALRFALWFACSMLMAPLRTTFVHSSVIVYRGAAVLFLGESGTGKSTHTRLWLKNIQGSRLLNDDSPALAIGSDTSNPTASQTIIYGSPWSGKAPCYINRCFPLAAVVRLSQAPHNAMRQLSVPEGFSALQPSLPPALMQDEWFADTLIGILSDVLKSAPFFHLECLPDADAAHLSCKTIFG